MPQGIQESKPAGVFQRISQQLICEDLMARMYSQTGYSSPTSQSIWEAKRALDVDID